MLLLLLFVVICCYCICFFFIDRLVFVSFSLKDMKVAIGMALIVYFARRPQPHDNVLSAIPPPPPLDVKTNNEEGGNKQPVGQGDANKGVIGVLEEKEHKEEEEEEEEEEVEDQGDTQHQKNIQEQEEPNDKMYAVQVMNEKHLQVAQLGALHEQEEK